jgi:hypothetical protein
MFKAFRGGGEDLVSAPAPASTPEAMDMVLAGLRYLAGADPAALAAPVQAECLEGLEQADAISTAARAWFLGAFTGGQGYCADADYSATAWLIHRTRVTKGAARGTTTAWNPDRTKVLYSHGPNAPPARAG